jgi:hypothetical protein
MIWRAEKTNLQMRFIDQPLLQCVDQVRFTDPGFAGNHHDAAFAADDLPPAAAEQFELGLAPD